MVQRELSLTYKGNNRYWNVHQDIILNCNRFKIVKMWPLVKNKVLTFKASTIWTTSPSCCSHSALLCWTLASSCWSPYWMSWKASIACMKPAFISLAMHCSYNYNSQTSITIMNPFGSPLQSSTKLCLSYHTQGCKHSPNDYSCVPNKRIVPNKSIGWQITQI